MKQHKPKHLTPDAPIVAIDLGTTAVRAMAARKQADGTFRILGSERIAVKTEKIFKEKGIVSNATEASNSIRTILRLLGNRIGMPEQLISAFVTIEGKGMQAVPVSAKRDQINRKHISQSLLNDMEKECKQKIEDRYPDYTVVGVEPILFILDDQEQDYPPEDEQKARWVEGKYIATLCQSLAVEKMQGSFDRANIVIEHKWASSEALITALTNEEDNREGCAIIHMGAQTTTLIIYKADQIKKVKTICLGGYHITHDIEAMHISFGNAEKIKQLYGKAAEKQVSHGQMLGIPSTAADEEKIKLPTTLLARIIQMRLYETVQPLMREINDHAAEISRIYVSGGGAMLDGVVDYLQEMTSLPVSFGTHADWLSMGETETEYFKPEYATLIGTLALGANYREQHHEEPLPQRPFTPGGFFGKRIIDLFTDTQQ